jgi:hypothetical protein
MGTLTYAGSGVRDPAQVRRDVGVFFRDLRDELGGEPFPYLWVPEWHKTDHGLHLHFGVGHFVRQRLIEQTWGRGFVSIKRLSNLPVGSTSLHEARRVAGYLSKYVSKSFDAGQRERPRGLHRFDVAQGFQPRTVRFRGVSVDGVLGSAVEVMGEHPSQMWSSDVVEGWRGPPAVWFAWD